MKTGKKITTAIAANDHFNYELFPGVTIVEICDQDRILVENHRGILCYDANEIKIKTRYGSICVCGRYLKLMKMSKMKLVITGKIHGVTLLGREG